MFSHWSLMCANATDCTFSMLPQLGVDMNADELQTVSTPISVNLLTLYITVSNVKHTEFNGVCDIILNNWSAEIESAVKLAAETKAIRQNAKDSGYVLQYNVKTKENPSVNQINAVKPTFRETLVHIMLGATWSRETAPRRFPPRARNWSSSCNPDAGAYLNEADINKPNFQQAYHSSNYDYLYQIKQKYDPCGILDAATAVVSEDWYITDQIDYYPAQTAVSVPSRIFPR
ncbi:FAD binding domain protein [Colletotrichum tofieldiae]|nr:FAD binding domain protein [Colletotrichum tofieldiae]